jgi:hypothetical protein
VFSVTPMAIEGYDGFAQRVDDDETDVAVDGVLGRHFAAVAAIRRRRSRSFYGATARPTFDCPAC